MNTITKTLSSITGAALVTAVVFVSPARAEGPGADSSSSSESSQRYQYYAPDSYGFPQSMIEKVPDAFANQARARMLLMRANADMTYLFRKMRFEETRSPEYRAVANDERDSYKVYQSARDAALAKLAQDEKYKAVVELRDELGARLDEMRQVKEITPEDLLPIAEERMNYSRTVSAMEAQALAADANVVAARDRFIAAGAKLADAKVNFDDSLRYHPAVETVRTNIADAKINVVTTAAYTKGLLKASEVAVDYAYYVQRQNRSPVYSTYDYGYGYGNNKAYNYYGYGR